MHNYSSKRSLSKYRHPNSHNLSFLQSQICIPNSIINQMILTTKHVLIEKVRDYIKIAIEQLKKQNNENAVIYLNECLRVSEYGNSTKKIFDEQIMRTIYCNLAYVHEKMLNFQECMKYLKNAFETIQQQINGYEFEQLRQTSSMRAQIVLKQIQLIQFYFRSIQMSQKLSNNQQKSKIIQKFIETYNNIVNTLVYLQMTHLQKNSQILLKLQQTYRQINYQVLKKVSLQNIKKQYTTIKKHRKFYTPQQKLLSKITLQQIFRLNIIKQYNHQTLVTIEQLLSYENVIKIALYGAIGFYVLSQYKQYNQQTNIQKIINKNYSKLCLLQAISILISTKLQASHILAQLIKRLSSKFSINIERSEYFPNILQYQTPPDYAQKQLNNDQFSTDFQMEADKNSHNDFLLKINSEMKINNIHYECKSNNQPIKKDSSQLDIVVLIGDNNKSMKEYRGKIKQHNYDCHSAKQDSRKFRKTEKIYRCNEYNDIITSKKSKRDSVCCVSQIKKKVSNKNNSIKSIKLRGQKGVKNNKERNYGVQQLGISKNRWSTEYGDYYFPSNISKKIKPFKAKRSEQTSLTKNKNTLKIRNDKYNKKINRQNCDHLQQSASSQKQFYRILDFLS